MLSKLFGSKARVKILKIFILHPDQKYYIQQLSRQLGLQANSIRRELENLETFGLLVSEIANDGEFQGENEDLKFDENKRKNAETGKGKKSNNDKQANKNEKKYFQINKEFVLFDEIKELIVKAQILYERDFVEKIKKMGKIRLFLLTGFFVNHSESPIDIFIVGHVSKTKFLEIINELEKELGREINFTIMNTSEFRYRKDMTDVFLYRILEGKNIVITDELEIYQ